MNQAEEYITQHPDEAKAIAKKKLDLSDDDVRRVWSLTQFILSLDSSLIVAMRDEARWIINNNLTTEKQVPNFLDYIYEDGLKAVKPGVVDIVR
jgi:NitT/TauT family transport system substrate-binding protein